MRFLVLAAALGLLAAPAAAQAEDQQTRDHERQDRRYYERMQQQERRPAGDDEQAAQTRREAFLARAEELVRDKNYDVAGGEHYRVQTDDPRIDPEQAVALLESFRGHFSRFWAERGLAANPPEDQRSRVFLFYSFYKYNQLLAGDWRFSAVRPQGHYINTVDVVAAHSGGGDPSDLPDNLVHEAAHQLVDRALYAGGYAPSPWVSEGLAGYFGYTLRDADGGFRPGEVGGKGVSLMRGQPARRPAQSEERLRELRRALSAARSGAAPVADEVLRTHDPAGFYGGQVARNYAASWMLVHFLLHGEDGRRAGKFIEYLALEREGGGGAEALYGLIGLGPAELDAALLAHARQVKIR